MIIEVDEYKKKIPGYDPNNSEDFHIESAKLADKDFINSLKSLKYKRIILMSGGTASGKTEFATSYLTKKDQLVFDATLKDYSGFLVKLDKIERYDKNESKLKVVLIIPESWTRAFEAFTKRDRKMKYQTFFETQIKSKLTVAKILSDTKIKVEVYISKVEEGKDRLGYLRINFKRVGGRISLSKKLYKIAESERNIARKNGFEIKI